MLLEERSHERAGGGARHARRIAVHRGHLPVRGLAARDSARGPRTGRGRRGRALREVYAQTAQSLVGVESGFELLLPEEEQPIDARTAALAQWCQGFLYGLGSRVIQDASRLPGDAGEVVRDLSEITRAAWTTRTTSRPTRALLPSLWNSCASACSWCSPNLSRCAATPVSSTARCTEGSARTAHGSKAAQIASPKTSSHAAAGSSRASWAAMPSPSYRPRRCRCATTTSSTPIARTAIFST